MVYLDERTMLADAVTPGCTIFRRDKGRGGGGCCGLERNLIRVSCFDQAITKNDVNIINVNHASLL